VIIYDDLIYLDRGGRKGEKEEKEEEGKKKTTDQLIGT
jgi:hypothetical protein